MADIVDCCRVWESHRDVETESRTSATAPSGGPNTGSPHLAIDGNDMPTEAGGTGAISSDGIGNHATELAPGPNSHGGKSCVAKSINCFRRGVFFVRSLDPSFPFVPTGWQAERIGDQFILGPGPPASLQGQQMVNAD